MEHIAHYRVQDDIGHPGDGARALPLAPPYVLPLTLPPFPPPLSLLPQRSGSSCHQGSTQLFWAEMFCSTLPAAHDPRGSGDPKVQ